MRQVFVGVFLLLKTIMFFERGSLRETPGGDQAQWNTRLARVAQRGGKTLFLILQSWSKESDVGR